jgi:hypothetical protein
MPPEVATRVAEHIPLGRAGSATDIALACVFLCSSAASFITAETLVVDGGQWMYKEPFLSEDDVSGFSKAAEGNSRRLGPGGKSKL